MMSGAIAICRRSSRFDSRNIETVTPPPSMKIRWHPRLRSSARTPAASRLPSSSSTGITRRTPEVALTGLRQRARADIERIGRVVAEHAILIGQTAAGIEDDAQAGLGPARDAS